MFFWMACRELRKLLVRLEYWLTISMTLSIVFDMTAWGTT